MTGAALAGAFGRLPTQPLEQAFFRVIHAKYAATALSAVGSLHFGGRYNPAGSFEVLYLTEGPVTALEEIGALLRTSEDLQGIKGPPRILLSVESNLQAVICVSDHLGILGLELSDLTLPWRDKLRRGETPATHTLGGLAHRRGDVEALVVPSARNPQTRNLAVFPDRLHEKSSLRVFDGSGMIDAQLP